MKEARFRVWSKQSRTMYYSGEIEELEGEANGCHEAELVVTLEGDLCIANWELGCLFRTDSFELMQYTGLKDSYGTEEYFGYIVEEDGGTRRIIEDGCSVVQFRNPANNDIKHFWELRPHKVIGNVYENPELEEGK